MTMEISDKDWKRLIERIRKLENRLQRLVDSPIGQEDRK